MNIALVEWHWSGHHQTFFAHFVLSLEELGCRVLAICPNPSDAKNAVAALRNTREPGLSAAGATEFVDLTEQGRSLLPFARLRGMHHAAMRFIGIERLGEQWARKSGGRLDLVFYACIYDWDFWNHRYASPFLRTPWAGLYLHARSFRKPGSLVPGLGRPAEPERIFSGRSLKCVAILDEGIAGQVASCVGKPVVVFPDFTDSSLPSADEAGLAMKLRAFSSGRQVVGLLGHLHRTKGVTTFARMIGARNWEDTCFALAGEMDWSGFNADDRDEISVLLADSQLVWSHLARIPGEPRFNGLMSECDVLFAAYVDFPHSSNVLAKAAFLRKPVVVSDGYLMAERVRRYRLGEVVPEGDPDAAATAVRRILDDPAAWVRRNSPDWSAYLELHSFGALKKAFAKVIAS